MQLHFLIAMYTESFEMRLKEIPVQHLFYSLSQFLQHKELSVLQHHMPWIMGRFWKFYMRNNPLIESCYFRWILCCNIKTISKVESLFEMKHHKNITILFENILEHISGSAIEQNRTKIQSNGWCLIGFSNQTKIKHFTRISL